MVSISTVPYQIKAYPKFTQPNKLTEWKGQKCRPTKTKYPDWNYTRSGY